MLWTRPFFFFATALTAVLALGFLLNAPWATWIWPFYTYRMARIFIASILLAVAAPIFLIGLTRDWAAVRGGAINLAVMFAIMAIWTLLQGGPFRVTVFGTVAALFAMFQLLLVRLARPFGFLDPRPTPRLVIWSFAGFVLLLVPVGLALVLRVPNVLPWSVSANVSVLYGAVFLGAACYFAFAILTGVWSTARGPLLGFLAYDLVLIGPFLSQLSTVSGRYRTSLVVYTAVVVYSGLLAAFYLLRGPRK